MTKHFLNRRRAFALAVSGAFAAALLLLVWGGSLPAKPPGGGGGGHGGGGGGGGDPPPELPTFSYQSLGTLGGTWSTAEGVNNDGDVVGSSERADGSSGPYVYTADTGTVDLQSLLAPPDLDRPKMLISGPDLNGNGGGDVYVSSALTDSVVVYDGNTGAHLGDFVTPGSGGLDSPQGMAFDATGDLLVCSRATDEVLRYDGASGAFVGVFVSAGSGGLDDPVDMAFGPDGDLYVTSRWTNEILAYDGADGTFLGVFVGDDPATGPDESGGLVWPHAVEFDAGGDLLVSSHSATTREVLAYDGSSGAFLGVFVGDDPATGGVDESGGLAGPRDLTFGPNGDLYVADEVNDSVLRYDGQTGEFVDEFVAAGSGGLDGPIGLLFDAGDNLLVTSRDTDQVLAYQGPNDVDPGAFIDHFERGNGWVLIDASDINDAGQIVGAGYSSGAFGEFVQTAYRITLPGAGEMFATIEDLGVPGPTSGAGGVGGVAINDDGDVAGHFAPDGIYHAFLWTPEAGLVDLGILAGDDTLVSAINDRVGGDIQVAGYAHTPDGDRAWLYDTATGVMQDLGVINAKRGGLASRGLDLNNLGQVVGWATAARNKEHAFLYTGGAGMQDLGTLGGNDSAAHGVNDLWDVVGMADLGSGASVAFAYSPDTGMFDLEPQITNLPAPLNGLIIPHRVNNVRQMIGPPTGGVSEAYIITLDVP